MIRKMTFVITALFLVSNMVFAQTLEPLDLAKRIFSKNGMPNISSYVTGEYKGKPSGVDLPQNAKQTFALLEQTNDTAVVAMTVVDPAGRSLDTYLFFTKKATWKMSAFRALALTGIIEAFKNTLEKMTPQQVDVIIAKSQKAKDKSQFPFTSREEYNFELGNAKLTLELDKDIIQHFRDNKPEFNRLKNLALAQLKKEKTTGTRPHKLIEKYKSEYRKLFISSVSTQGFEFGSCINFFIGGMVDNTVGYLYVRDKKDLPSMTSDNIIMLRKIEDGWYLYKTT